MHIIYPYNEILPKKKAHDSYLYHSCAALAHAGMKVTLLCGKDSLSQTQLDQHYHSVPQPCFTVRPLPLIRKNNLFNISYNYPFFLLCQREIKKTEPDVVLLSVRKQGMYHLQRKLPSITYIYEVHELQYYPGDKITPEIKAEREMLARADGLVVTTDALRKLLQQPPYSLSVPIFVIPLASQATALPAPVYGPSLQLFYVGALYEAQGVGLLLTAIAEVSQVTLTLIGGTEAEINHYKKVSLALGIADRVSFLGFQPPSHLQKLVEKAEGFVAPFTAKGKMSYVAHTKLHEYSAWGRPIIAPDVAVVREHFGKGTLLFAPGKSESLAEEIKKLRDHRETYQMALEKVDFSWAKRMGLYKTAFTALKMRVV